MADLIIGTGEGFLVGLLLGLKIGSPLDSPNTGAELHYTLLGDPLGLCFGSEAARCLCSFRPLIYFHEAT